MHHGEGLIGVGLDSGGKPAALRVIQNEDRDIGAILVSQAVDSSM